MNISKHQKMTSSNGLGLEKAVDHGRRATIDGFVSDYASILIKDPGHAGKKAAARVRSH